jgi:hypothetical protein
LDRTNGRRGNVAVLRSKLFGVEPVLCYIRKGF